MDKTAVTKLLGVSWEAIGNIIERVVARRLDDDGVHYVSTPRRTLTKDARDTARRTGLAFEVPGPGAS
jgi:hypothetical protein